ncbi:MAG: Ig-like domain-containing protein [Coleofasciculus sp. A1-SPW-01]|uniref:Ig-like domain-containing protein n=1 Tax=Coleofasciculus sp. A1-SPW-01 TaxID=3070819 RepID=UPI0032FD8937
MTTLSFSDDKKFSTGDGSSAVGIGDYNGDGHLDLAVVNRLANNVAILLGDGTGNFGVALSLNVGTQPFDVAVADFNADGNLDLAVTNHNSNNVSVLLGNGTGGFSVATNFAVGTKPYQIAVADFNGDGKPDLAVANQDSHNVSILLGNGSGGFSSATNFAAGGTNLTTIIAADFNADGNQDVAVRLWHENKVAVLLGNGTGGLSSPTKFATGTNPHGLAVEDFNQDGKLDLAVANHGSNNVSVLLGNGLGEFGAATNFAVGTNPSWKISAADFNGDGNPDIAVPNHTSDNVSILLGNGSGNFSNATHFGVGDNPYGIAVGDFNEDGKPDFVVANYNSDNISLRLNTTNFPPVANNDNFTTDEDTAISLNLLANDSDLDTNDTLTISAVDTANTQGTVQINPDNTVTYTPATAFQSLSVGESITDQFTYTLDDGNNHTATAIVSVTVNGINDNPIANNDTATIDEDTATTIAILDNDSDIENDTVIVSGVDTHTTLGSVTINADGTITYNPNAAFQDLGAGETATDTFTYTITDGNQGTHTATVTVTITGVNDAPILSTINKLGNEDTPISFSQTDFSNAFSDVESDNPSQIKILSLPDAGILTLNGIAVTAGQTVTIADVNSLSFTPNPNFNGTTSFGWNASDGTIFAAGDTVNITVNPVNDAPVAQNDSVTTAADTAIGLNLLSNDSDADNDSLILESLETQNTLGTVSQNGDGTITYTPDSDFQSLAVGETVTDTFEYSISDGNGGTDTANVTITVTGVNDVPIAVDDSATTSENGAITLNLLTNDSDVDDSDTLSISSIDTTQTQGSVTLNTDGTVSYNPGTAFQSLVAGETATDTFSYTVNDENGGSDTAVVTVTVTGIDEPDIPVSFSDATNFAVGDEPHGPGMGIADFNLDGNLDIAVANLSSNNVSVLLGNGNGGFSAANNFGIANNPISVAVGDFNGDSQPDFAVTRYGTNKVSVRLGDGAGGFSAASEFTVGTNARNVAVGDFNSDNQLDLAVANRGSNNISVLLGNGLGGFSAAQNFGVGTNPVGIAVADFNSDSHSDLVVSNWSSNTISVLLGNGLGNFSTATNFTVGTNPGAVAIRDFNGDNQLDLAVANSGSNNVSILLGNGSGGFGVATHFAAGTGSREITVADFNADGKLDIATANVSANTVSILLGNGLGNFSETIQLDVGTTPRGIDIGDFNNDSKPDLAVANLGSDTVSIILNTSNFPPIAQNDTITTDENTPLIFNPLTNDQEPDGDSLTIDRIETNSTQGIVTLNQDGTITYNPDTAFNYLTTQETATDTFDYVVSDSTGRTNTATVTVTITGINDAPTLTSFNKIGQEDSAITFTDTDFINAYSDPESDNFTAIKLLSLPQNGTLTLNGNPVGEGASGEGASGEGASGEEASGEGASLEGASGEEASGEGASLEGASLAPLQSGYISITDLNSLTFTPDANYNGNTSFVWNASDGTNYSTGTTVNLIINPVNDSPVAIADNATTEEDTPVSVDILSNDSDILDGDTLYIDTFDIFSTNGGTITRDQRGTPNDSTDDYLLYTPAAGFNGEDSFNYTITDGQDTDTATVTITVNPVSNLTLFGTPNNDTLTGGNGEDLVFGEAGDDELHGGTANDFLSGGDDDDQLFGDAGDDMLMGEAGRDRIEGGVGHDTVEGGDGNDQLFGNSGDDILFGNSGEDIIRGDEDNDILYGGDDRDRLFGDTGNDFLLGEGDADILVGGDGDDTLDGGAGADKAYGNNGADQFILRVGEGSDTIFDFNPGEDTLGLAGGLSFNQLHLMGMGSTTLIQMQQSGEVLAMLIGVQANQVSVADFVVV